MDNDLSLLVGNTIQSFRKTSDELDLILERDAFRFYHMRDCCERVYIYDIIGDLNDLVGSPIVKATEEISRDWPDDVNEDAPSYDEFTWTVYTFHTNNHKVAVRWLGTSNGYYSERVYCHLTHKPVNGFEI
jgi:hypothetical protein